MCVGAGSVCSRFNVRSSNLDNGAKVAFETASSARSSESESLSDSATCFPAVTDELGSRALGGRELMTAAERCNRVVRDAGGNVVYLEGTNAAKFASRCTFASSPRSEYS